MLKFIDTWKIDQRKSWLESSREKISELEAEMEECLSINDHRKYFKLMDRLDQEQETYDRLIREIAALA